MISHTKTNKKNNVTTSLPYMQSFKGSLFPVRQSSDFLASHIVTLFSFFGLVLFPYTLWSSYTKSLATLQTYCVFHPKSLSVFLCLEHPS